MAGISNLNPTSSSSKPPLTLWSAADRGDTARVRDLLYSSRPIASNDSSSWRSRSVDVNARNCLGCTPLLYACGSGHLETVRALLQHPDIDVNRRNNDRLTCFMLAMQSSIIPPNVSSSSINSGGNSSSRGASANQIRDNESSTGLVPPRQEENAQEKLRRLMDLPATDDLEWSRQDRWTALMEACNFGHKQIVEILLNGPATRTSVLDIDAVNIRGQSAEDVARSRGHDEIAQLIRNARQSREHPEELPRLRELQEQVENLKVETRQRILQAIDNKYEVLADLKQQHEDEIEMLTQTIDSLQDQLDEAMKSRLTMITRQVREVKNVEDEVRQMRRQLDNFDRYASTGNLVSTATVGIGSPASSANAGQSLAGASMACGPSSLSSNPFGAGGVLNMESGASSLGNLANMMLDEHDRSSFDKEFECSVCLDEMRPPTKIFQCRNGHVMCEACKNHTEVSTCPTCRIPLSSSNSLMRNIPMEKLARSYYEQARFQISLLGNQGVIPPSPIVSSSASASSSPQTNRRSSSSVVQTNRGPRSHHNSRTHSPAGRSNSCIQSNAISRRGSSETRPSGSIGSLQSRSRDRSGSSIRGVGLPLSVHHNTSILTPERYNVPQSTVSASTTQLNDSRDQEDNDNGQSIVPGTLSQSTDSSLLDW